MVKHSDRCIADTIQAIADNNGLTLAVDPTTPEYYLTPETEEEATEWLLNGNKICRHDCE